MQRNAILQVAYRRFRVVLIQYLISLKAVIHKETFYATLRQHCCFNNIPTFCWQETFEQVLLCCLLLGAIPILLCSKLLSVSHHLNSHRFCQLFPIDDFIDYWDLSPLMIELMMWSCKIIPLHPFLCVCIFVSIGCDARDELIIFQEITCTM